MSSLIRPFLCLTVVRSLLCLLACLTAPAWLAAHAQASGKTDSLLLLLRHANAPGTGDPAYFDVDDCQTQRNLDAQGRAQARALGHQLTALGIRPTHIWTSQWCRSIETARLLGLGPVTALPALNSFFRNPSEGPAQIEQLRRLIEQLDPKGGPYVMVSHQVVVGGLANAWVQSGGGVWLELTGDPAQPWRVHNADPDNLTLPVRQDNSPHR